MYPDPRHRLIPLLWERQLKGIDPRTRSKWPGCGDHRVVLGVVVLATSGLRQPAGYHVADREEGGQLHALVCVEHVDASLVFVLSILLKCLGGGAVIGGGYRAQR